MTTPLRHDSRRAATARSLAAVVCAAAIAGTVPAFAQSPPVWRYFSTLDGMPESWVADVTIGPSGRVFVTHGAVDTMSVYDGFTFSRLPTPGDNLTVREGPDGTLWALLPVAPGSAEFRGLQVLTGRHWAPYPLPDVTPFAPTRRAFLPWARDRVLVVTPQRLVEFDRQSGRTRDVLTASAAGLGEFLGCSAGDSGAWVVAATGVMRLQPTGIADRTWRFPATVRAAAGALVSEDRDGSVVVSLAGSDTRPGTPRIVRVDSRGTTVLATGESAVTAGIIGWPAIDGRWWVARVQANLFDLALSAADGRVTPIPRNRPLSGRWSSVTPDGAGGMWLSTALGLARHIPAAWREPPGLSTASLATGAIIETRSGGLAALQAGHLITSRDGLSWQAHPLPRGTDASILLPNLLAELPDGRLAFGYAAGLRTFDPATGRFDVDPNAVPGSTAIAVIGPARNGGAWLVTNPAGDWSTLATYGSPLPPGRVQGSESWRGAPPRMVLETSNGERFVIPDGDGIGRIRGNAVEHIGHELGFPGLGPYCGTEVARGVIWIGDRDSVIEFDGSRWRTIRQGLQSVRSILLARDGTIWVASGTGLHRHRDGSWLQITSAEGLPDGAVVDLLEDSKGRLWVTTTAGIALYHPEADRDGPQTIIDTTLNSREVPPSGVAVFTFQGADRWNYTPADRLLYSWRIDEGPWSPFQDGTTATVSGLASGAHRFSVRAMDRNGNVSTEPATMKLEVLRPWYMATGFLLFALPSLLLAGSVVGLFVTRYVRLDRLVRQRTQALEAAHHQVLSEAQERRHAEAQLHQAQKMDAVGRLAGGVAHDFNNLLTVISGYADLLQDELDADDTRRSSVEEIARAAASAKALTRQLLAFGRHQVIRTERLDLNLVVQEISRMLTRLIGEDVTLVFAPTPGLWPVAADRGQIEQIIVNLAVNARDAMPKGGRLTIGLQNATIDDEFSRTHREAKPGPYVRLSVTDNGTGMDAATIGRIFEPFFTTKDAGKGTGLGLSLVYGIVRQTGGHITVNSEPGHGTTFDVYLPRAEAVAEPLPTAPVAAASPAGTETVLVVEDSPGVRELAVTGLKRFGYRVLQAASAEEAERFFEEHVPVALVVTDIVMTGLSGPELIDRLLARAPGLRFVFMSGYADRTVLEHGLRDGDVAFLQKPFTAEELARKVRDTLDAPPAGART